MAKKPVVRDLEYAARVKAERLKRNLPIRQTGQKKRLVDVTPKKYVAIPPGLKTPPFDCVYRGARTNIKTCRGCGKPERVAVFQCTIHGRCTYNIEVEDEAVRAKVCTSCLDRAEPTDSTDIPLSLAKPDIALAQDLLAQTKEGTMEWAVGITTAPRLDYTLDAAAMSVIESGFGDFTIYAEPESHIGTVANLGTVNIHPVKLGAFKNWQYAMADLVGNQPSAAAYMIIQDDSLLAGRGLRPWLEKHIWPVPAKDAPMACLSLYTGKPYSLPHAAWGHRLGWVWGAHAFVFTGEQAREYMESDAVHNWRNDKGIDTCVGSWSRATGKHVYFPSPSLCQHVGHHSTLWKAETRATGNRRSTSFIGYNSPALERLELGDAITSTAEEPAANADVMVTNAGAEGVTVITPTGDRHRAFKLLERWMDRQSYTGPIQWLVVDDGVEPTPMHRGQQYIRRKPSTGDEMPSLNMNLKAAIPEVKYGTVLIMEDDDWYGDDYVRQMHHWLREFEMVGQANGYYYNLEKRGWWRPGESSWISLCRTGFRRYMLPQFEFAVHSKDWKVDTRFWEKQRNSHSTHTPQDCPPESRCVSMKGAPGRRGYTWSWNRPWIPDPDGAVLKEWIGADAAHYDLLMDDIGQVVVYTTALAGATPPSTQPLDPPEKRTAYVCFAEPGQRVVPPWRAIPFQQDDAFRENPDFVWKTIGHMQLAKGDFTIWLDPGVILAEPPHATIRKLIDTLGDRDGFVLPGAVIRRCTPAMAKASADWLATKVMPEEILVVA